MYLFTRRWFSDFSRMLIRAVHTWLVTVNNRFFFRVHAGLEAGFPGRVRAQFGEGWSGRRLLAICDFMALPISWDILVFLFIADNRRRALGLDRLDVAFVSHAGDPGVLPPEHMNPDLLANARDYIHNLGQEAARLLPSVGSVLYFDNRRQFYDFHARSAKDYAWFPETWTPARPSLTRPDQPALFSYIHFTRDADPAEALCLTPRPLYVDMARQWLRNYAYPRIPVTLTLREYMVQTRKNSDIPEWQRVIDSYRDSDLVFIVLPDFTRAYEPPALHGPNVVHFTDPVVSLSLRAALYQESSLNLFVNNGPAALCWLTRHIPYCIFKIVSDDRSATVPDLERICGLKPGDQYWGAGEFQRLVWADDTYEAIRPEVDALLEGLAAAGRLRPAWYPETGGAP